MKNYINKIIIGVIVVSVLVFAFVYGGDSQKTDKVTEEKKVVKVQSDRDAEAEVLPSDFSVEENAVTEENPEQEIVPEEKPEGSVPTVHEEQPVPSEEPVSAPEPVQAGEEYSAENTTEINEVAETEKNIVVPAPEEQEKDETLTCTLSVRCDTILDSMGLIDKEKVDIVPENGIIYAEKTVDFCEGESVFDLLYREMKSNKIHLEFEDTPIYNSAYIEGIGNLYEFDCGELSGWMYKVNGSFPNYGCSQYHLEDGDRVEWVYTCNLGVDVGGSNFAGKGNGN